MYACMYVCTCVYACQVVSGYLLQLEFPHLSIHPFIYLSNRSLTWSYFKIHCLINKIINYNYPHYTINNHLELQLIKNRLISN